ncbi:MAG: SEC-C domain-containing protein [Deltaproteobacteria bacterium]|nr:SEC-C domain-containing protein [Deltaproteobacteria bacterium]
MSYLWTIENLSTLTRHPAPKVREWASERLKTLYGNDGISALEGLLKERDRGLLTKALDYLLEYPSPQFADLALDIYKRENGHIAGMCAMVLAKLKDNRLVSAFDEKEFVAGKEGLIELLAVCKALGELGTDAACKTLQTIIYHSGKKPDTVSIKTVLTSILDTGSGVDTVLEFYLNHYKNSGTAVISALMDYCQFWHNDEELSEGKKGFFRKGFPPVVENAIHILKSNSGDKIGRELERLFRKEDFSGVIAAVFEYADNLVKEAAEHVGDKSFSEWDMRESQAKTNYDLILAIKNLPSHPKDADKGLAMAAIGSLARLDEMKLLIGLSITMGIKVLLDEFLEDRGDTVDDKWIEEILLNSSERDTVVDETIRIIKWKAYSLGTRRGISLLGLIGDERAIPCLVELIGKKSGDLDDETIDEALAALVRFGERALPALEKLMDGSDRSAINEAFFILKDIPAKKTEELLLRNWDRFMGINRELFTMALGDVASKEFIPLLRKEIKEGELIEAEVFHLLCLIHGVKDPLLPQIEEELKRSEEEMKKAFAGFKEGGLSSLIEAPLNLELKCMDCGRAYHYKIDEVVINSEKPGSEPEITDMITCKNCGSVNNYELTDKGSTNLAIRASMIAGLLKEGKIEDPLALPIKFMKMRFMGNRPMSSFKEAIEEYRRELEKSPHDPALRIGYGNMLRRKGMLNEAESQFSEAARLEPNAVEAYTQLGEIAEKRGDIHAAYNFYAKALQRMPDARYFRTQDIDGYKEMVVDKHHYLRQIAEGKTDVNLIEDVIKIEPHRKKAGRNDPCPCGSGKKYKKCCLAKDEAASHKTAVTLVESSLTDRLLSFALQQRLKKDFESAYSLYFKKPFREPVVMDEEDIEFGVFLDWFIHDFLLKSGKTVVEEFYQENFRRISGEEKAVLESEMLSYLSVYEVAAVVPDEGLMLHDLITGEEFEVKDVRGSRSLVRWDIVIARAIRHKAANKLSGFVMILPRDDRERFMAVLSARREEFRKETGKKEWSAFLKSRGYLLFHTFNERETSTPVPFTEERHRLIEARAEYYAADFQSARRLLSNEFDFVLDEEKEGKELQYTWLKRGKSEAWEEGKLPKEAGMRPIIMQSQLISQGGEVRFSALGSIKITANRLTLECISKERLERGKARLKEILGDIVQHKQDSVKAFEPSGSERDKRPSENIETGIDNEAKISLMSRYYSQYVEEWIKSPIPALNGLSPLESCKTEAGRARVDEILKGMENSEERNRRDGKPYMDVNKIREKLEERRCEKGKK